MMFRFMPRLGWLVSLAFLSAASAVRAQLVSIPVENHSFELPDLGPDVAMTHPEFGQQVPGWIGEDKDGNPTTESGVTYAKPAQGMPELDGLYNAYCGNYSAIPNGPSSFYQSLNYPIKAGETYTLTFWGNSPYSSPAWPQGQLYYLDGAGNRVILASSASGYPTYKNWVEISVSFIAESGAPYIGRSLGIRFRAGGGSHFVHFDNVSVTAQHNLWVVAPEAPQAVTVYEPGPAASPVTYTITNLDGASHTVDITESDVDGAPMDYNWLSLSADRRTIPASGQDTVDAVIDQSGLAAGTHTAYLKFSDTAAPGSDKIREIQLTVIGCQWQVSPFSGADRWHFLDGSPGNIQDVIFTIKNAGAEGLTYTVTQFGDCGWLNLDKTGGGPLGIAVSDEVRATINPSGLAEGIYTCELSFASNCDSAQVASRYINLSVQQTPSGNRITVENHSFELPDLGADVAMTHPVNGQQVPGWIGEDRDGNPTTESGVTYAKPAQGLPELDGSYNAYCGNHSSIPNGPSSFYQSLNYPIKAGETYTLTFWGNSPYAGAAWPQGQLYYLDGGGNRVILASSASDYPTYKNWVEIPVSFTAEAGAPYIGQTLGIRFRAGGGSHYVHFDNVSVTAQQNLWVVAPEAPQTVTVYEPGPAASPVTYTITNLDGTSHTVDITESDVDGAPMDYNWLSLSADRKTIPASGQDTVDAVINQSGLAAGTHTAYLKFSDTATPESDKIREIQLTVIGCQWQVSPSSAADRWYFLDGSPGNIEDVVTTIQNTGAEGLTYTVTQLGGYGWLNLNKTGGGPLGMAGSDEVRATINPSGLAEGIYTCELMFASNCHSAQVVSRYITLSVRQTPNRITVENHSFELPNLGADLAMTHPVNGQQVPGWIGEDKDGNPTTESGVTYAKPTQGMPELDGAYNAYCGNHSSIPNRPSSFYQNLNYTIKAGEIYTLTFWGNSPYSGSAWPQGQLYYLDGGGNRVILASSASGYPTYKNWVEIPVSFTAEAGAPYIGQTLGIRFRAGGGSHYVHFDNVSVTISIPCPIPFADFDRDGDVDQVDFAAFQRCYTGNNGGLLRGCECFDRDGQEDVDARDLEQFELCATGPAIEFDPGNPPVGCTP